MASPVDKLAAPVVPDNDPSSRRSVDILLAHGQCLYSENAANFQPLVLRQNVHQGAIIKTGKSSWCDSSPPRGNNDPPRARKRNQNCQTLSRHSKRPSGGQYNA